MSRGERIYIQTMANGGGKNDEQANGLLNLPLVDFWKAMLYVNKLIRNPSEFAQLAQRTNEIHEKINAKGKWAPTDLSPRMLIEDMLDTFDCAAQGRSQTVKWIVVNLMLVRLDKLRKRWK